MNSLNKNSSYLNLSKISMKHFSKQISTGQFSINSLYKHNVKFFARTTAGSKAELDKRWKEQLEGFKQNWQKDKDDNYEQYE